MAQDNIGVWNNNLLAEQIERDRRARQYTLPAPDSPQALAERLQHGAVVNMGDGNMVSAQHDAATDSILVRAENMETQQQLTQRLPQDSMRGLTDEQKRTMVAMLMMAMLRQLAEMLRQRREQQGSNNPGVAPPKPEPRPQVDNGQWVEKLKSDLTDIFIKAGVPA